MIYFDMDGTIANLYGVTDWLNFLLRDEVYPYCAAQPLIDMISFRNLLRLGRARGHSFGVISWASKNASDEYIRAIRRAKIDWLNIYGLVPLLDEIHIVPYGTPKHAFSSSLDSILFDDEERNIIDFIAHGMDAINVNQTSLIGALAQIIKG